ncbi:hypothetical protein RI129_000429 [Pyrocoelia pectoralis]|uniref:Beta-galactosidase n=1 Tax=Pyrocoelia pectoralis TaxID=417401 RepID=A0AAN7ZJA9_9COLE
MSILPTLYEYYTNGGIVAGLSSNQNYFTLNNKNITLYSGSMNYFRIPEAYWRDRLRKMRAAGLNTVDTYIPWNLHEFEMNHFDFDLQAFLRIAQEEDLLAIVRPGPYISAEWDFGGLPSWLLRDKEFNPRTSNSSFMKHVTRYFNILLPLLAALQFTFGGPIIAFQLDNEVGAMRFWPFSDIDPTYLEGLHKLYILFQTANFADFSDLHLNRLKQLQPNKPAMVMEYWTGWFDNWSGVHSTRTSAHFKTVLNRILKYPASVNMYMFHGGTNYGFLNGANIYDYDAPLTEAGDYTDKYYIAKDLISKYNAVVLKTPEMPKIMPKVAYPKIKMTHQLKFLQIEERLTEKFNYSSPVSMEMLPINNGSGQSYGYIIYQKKGLHIPAYSELKISGYVWDTVMVVIDGELISKPLFSKHDLNTFGYWRVRDGKLNLGSRNRFNATLQLIVENFGRNNFGFIPQFRQFKGLWQGDIYLNSEKVLNWETVPLQFKRKWTNNLSGWEQPANFSFIGPSLYKAWFTVTNPQDTFIDMRKWTKGIVIINGFVLGRYVSPLGPQQTLYLPAPLVKNGTNEIVVFEHFIPASEITFTDKSIYHTPGRLFGIF